MTALQQVEQAIAAGDLRRPARTAPSFVDLATAVLRLAGVKLQHSGHSQAIIDLIREPHHLLFILVDGMGSFVIDQLESSGLVRSGMRMEIDAVFPATTACAMTTLATATWPAEHGVPGWYGYLAERDIATTVLKFEERFQQRPLADLGVALAELWPLPPLLGVAERDVCVILPEPIAHSTYSGYQTGGRQTRSYSALQQLPELIGAALTASSPSFTYCYLPEFDALCHEHGARSEQAIAALRGIDALLGQVRDRLPSDARMLVSADHGLLDVADEDTYLLRHDDALLRQLRSAPCGEPRTPHLFVKEGEAAAVREALVEATAGAFAFVTQAEAERVELFGPGGLSAFARRRFGDLIGVALRPATLELALPLPPGKAPMRGRHGGMAVAEVRVPVSLH